MWVTKLLISPVKKRIFCPKTNKFGPKLAFLVNLGHAMQAYSMPFWWVIWWLRGAGCISQDTYLLYANDDDKDDDDADEANLHVTILLLEHGALPLGRQQDWQEPRHGKAGDEFVVFISFFMKTMTMRMLTKSQWFTVY